ncbi:hypothetical protein [Vibrio hippocampi]|uniref:Uncharacterized protein n=1 Tax=Vibrio hippocampi TaxID=654686 RepID=A0ABN8DI28_9VIBR|nr:hypothetical protein [Vibrio hippocampi]CAH0526219.1 hypothetical protein VHP8226_01690 [Vibrio hippocampi]
MSNKDKALAIANDAKQSAEQLTSNLTQSDAFARTSDALGKAKAAASEVDYSGIKIMNLFSVFAYALLLLSTYLPFAELFGASISLGEFSPTWLYLLAICGLLSHLFGAKQALSRLLTLSLLATVVLKAVSAANDMMQVSSYGSRNTYSLPLDLLGLGSYVFLAALVLLLVVLFKPGYKTNSALWKKLIQK